MGADDEAEDESAASAAEVGCTLRGTGFERATIMAEAPEVMNIRQASTYLGVSPDTLYKYVSEGKIPAFKLGNRWKFKKALLDRWMESKSSGGELVPKKTPRAIRQATAR